MVVPNGFICETHIKVSSALYGLSNMAIYQTSGATFPYFQRFEAFCVLNSTHVLLKTLPPFTFDLLCYLNRDQLEQFSIVCRPLKNIIERYFHSKPYRVFDKLIIRGGSYALVQNNMQLENGVQWHPNRDDYSVQQFLAGQECFVDESKPWFDRPYYSFADMRPYLFASTIVRVKMIEICVAEDFPYSQEHIEEMESISYLWRDGNIEIIHAKEDDIRIVAEDFHSILNSPTILQCRKLSMNNAHFSFKDYKVLYTMDVIDIFDDSHEDVDHSYWTEFLEHPGVTPIVALHYSRHEDNVNAFECLKKTFSSAVVSNAFKVLFPYVDEPLTEFRETNKTLGEKLELKRGLSTNCESINAPEFDKDYGYTLERSSI